MEPGPCSERLSRRDHAGNCFTASEPFQVAPDRPVGGPAQAVEQRAVVSVLGSHHLRKGEHGMVMRHRCQPLLEDPRLPRLGASRLTARAEPPALAREDQQSFVTAVGTADASEPVHRVAAIQEPRNHLLCDRPESTQLMLELFLVDREELIPVVLE